MFIEIALIACVAMVVCLLFGEMFTSSRTKWIAVFALIGILAFVGSSTVAWQHETKVITIEDKFITATSPTIIGSDGIAYKVIDSVVYSKLKIDGSYLVETGKNCDMSFWGIPCINNIDRVLS